MAKRRKAERDKIKPERVERERVSESEREGERAVGRNLARHKVESRRRACHKKVGGGMCERK